MMIMKTRNFIITIAITAGLAMTFTGLTSCSNEDNPEEPEVDVPSVGGASDKVAGNWTYRISGNDVILTGYIGNDKDTLTTLNIPLTVDDNYVTYISWSVDFKEFKNLETLNFADGCRIDEMPSMKDCSNLQHVNSGKEADILPKYMTTVKGQTFKGTAIKKINLHRVSSIGGYIFQDCESLDSIFIPNIAAQDNLNEYAFADIPSKCIISLGFELKRIKWTHVAWSPQVILVSQLEAMGWCGDDSKIDQDFLYWKYDDVSQALTIACAQLGIDNYPDKQIIKTCRWKDYTDYTKNTTKLKMSGVYAIGKEEFKGMKALNTATLNEGLTSIGESAFENCESLKNITIPASVTSIGSKAFAGCKNLTEVTILGHPTIAADAFPNGVEFK